MSRVCRGITTDYRANLKTLFLIVAKTHQRQREISQAALIFIRIRAGFCMGNQEYRVFSKNYQSIRVLSWR